MNVQELKRTANQVRKNIITAVYYAKAGHPGGSLSSAEIYTYLYMKEMNIDPADPGSPDRDRFVLSKGHTCPGLYGVMAERGFFDKKELLTLNRGGTNLPSHCDMNRTVGIDMTTGSLGQGFSCAVGAALGSILEKDGAIIYTMIGDGESQEGQIWEAAMFAAAKKLDNLIAFTDYNKLQIDGTVEQVNDIAPLAEKWAAFGWNVIDVEDGNDVEQVEAAVEHAKLGAGSEKPTMIILNTLKGCGVQWIVDLGSGNHNCPVSMEQAEAAIREIRGED